MKLKPIALTSFLCLASTTWMIDCSGHDGSSGDNGAPGASGVDGTAGSQGENGRDGVDGIDGSDGLSFGTSDNTKRAPGLDPSTPLSSVVALTVAPNYLGAKNIPELVRTLVDRHSRGVLGDIQFPVPIAATDSLRTTRGLRASVLSKWLDPLTFENDRDAPRFGANNDYIAYFGDGWENNGAPQWHGRGDAGWVWVNHEYISGTAPTVATEPTAQNGTFARHLNHFGVVTSTATFAARDVDNFLEHAKKQLGGSWMRIIKDDSSGSWSIDRGANNLRYDATSSTLLRITGTAISGVDHADDGTPLPTNVVAGIMGDCSGGQTPWGTVITAEENVQDYYGDLESCWDSQQRLIAGRGCDAGAAMSFTIAPSTSAVLGAHSDPNQRHARDLYGYLSEIDVGVDPAEYEGKTSPGVGHKKIGAMGRARWENAAIAVDGEWKLVDGQPIVIYGGDDRRSGRIFKFVTEGTYSINMSRAETRALLDRGRVYVAHFAGLDNLHGLNMAATGVGPTRESRGQGRWIWLSTENDVDDAPNAASLAPGTKVGRALRDVSWNNLGGFATDDDVRRALFTASNKIGVMELNRPEDLEWNPRSPAGVPQLFIAFTNHGRRTALDSTGVLIAPPTHAMVSVVRPDVLGGVFVLEESEPSNPGASSTFSFYEAWRGTEGNGVFDAANPDNLVIDQQGGVWFGTDGNFNTNGHADGIYYLDLDPTHRAGEPGITEASFGRAFRVMAAPSDAETTGPSFSSDARSLFISVQHPGEDTFSVWP